MNETPLLASGVLLGSYSSFDPGTTKCSNRMSGVSGLGVQASMSA